MQDNFKELEVVIKDLRLNDAWSKGLTLKTIIPKFTKEFEEVLVELNSGDMDRLCDELGDLMFHVFMITEITGEFEVKDCLAKIVNKMKERHLKEME